MIALWQYGLKGQQLIAQGSAPGTTIPEVKRPARAKALLSDNNAFALAGRSMLYAAYPERCPGLVASGLSGRIDSRIP